MKSGTKTRLIIHNILYEIYKKNKNLKDRDIEKLIVTNSSKDIKFITNVCLYSMRNFIYCDKIINLYLNKKPKLNQRILLISAITQIVYLDFKEYAVVNSSVEIAKKIKVYPGLINAVLKKIVVDKNRLAKIQINFSDLPIWFKNETKDLKAIEKKSFIKNIKEEGAIHIVFKNKDALNNFERKIIKTSLSSGFLVQREKINKIPSYNNGQWWVQDYMSYLPISILPKKFFKGKCLDLCSAPGGKGFQIINIKKDEKKVVLNDKSKSKLKTLKDNCKRLSFSPIIRNDDGTLLNLDGLFDFILVDAPCSSVGTIRKNPEIFFKKNNPDINRLLDLQQKLLSRAAIALNTNGILVYMVCSFLKRETTEQINSFLKINRNFRLIENIFDKSDKIDLKFINQSYISSLPNVYKGFNVDGFFAAYMEKYK